MLKFNKKIQTIAHDYSFEKGTGQYIKENLPYFKKSLEAFPHYKLENEDDILDKIIGLAIIFTEYSNRKKISKQDILSALRSLLFTGANKTEIEIETEMETEIETEIEIITI